MAKGLNQVQVGLTFTADTGQAKAQLQDLKNTINGLYSSTAQKSPIEGLTPKVNEALTSVAKLKTALESATNVDTGRLDLSKFSQQLKQNGVSLKQYANQLTQLGPDGEKAFLQLAQSIVTAEVPMRKANAALTEMWTTLKNTARWQISSSILHGFMGAVQSAYGYAQDLNESLNNIRIVTGYNTDQMSKFADQANKSAKALSATTTEYTNASLIYYQQGLSDSEVKERTDITIKMANAAGQSAEIVSDQMTAVWNNFDDGSKSLEYYADVMTALGAATASSTDEIAQGLEKFSAVAGTVGLSYEYATAALATVTAETRQSADVVGTAFKTLFARIEGLQLGETLEDGTDLNKYSQALATVGIQIKDAAGEMRSMDDILNDLGARWQTLAKDEQIALAQTVAGVRQYNQLISLMDNWDVMQENLGTAYDSTGTLQEQADIYAESWEAARDRVQASLETIYSSLIDDQFFIKMTDGLASLIDKLGMFTESLGGLPGVLSMVAAVMTKVFGNQIQANISQMIDNFQIFNGAAKNAADQTRQVAIEAVQYFSRGVEVDSASGMESQVMVDQINRTYELQQISENLTQERADYLRQMIQIEEQYGKEAVAAQKAAEAATTNYTKSRSNTKLDIVDANIEAGGDAAGGEELAQAVFAQSDAFKTLQNLGSSDGEISSYTKEIEELHQLGVLYPELQKKYENYTKALKSNDPAQIQKATSELRKEVKHFANDTDYAERSMEKQAIRFKQARKDIPITTKNILKLSKQAREQGKSVGEASKAWEAYQKRLGALDTEFKKGQQAVASLSKGLTTSIQGISAFAMGLNSLKSAWDTFQNPDMSGMEKFISLTMSLSMGIPSLVKGLKDITSGLSLMRQGFGGSLASMAAFVLGVNAETLAEKENNEEKQKSIIWSQAKDSASKKEILSSIAKAGANKLEAESEEEGNEEKQKKIALTLADIVVEKLATVAKGTGTAATIAQTIANIALQTSMSPLLVITLLLTAAILALAAIIIGVVVGIKALSDAYNKDAQAAQAAQEQVKSLENAYNDAKTAAENFKSTVSDWSEAAKELENLEQGTAEYVAKLEEANAQARELIETYGLYNDFTVDTKTGLITIDEKALQNKADSLISNSQRLEKELYASKIIANEATSRSAGTDLGRDMGVMATGNYYTSSDGYSYAEMRTASSGEMEQFAQAIEQVYAQYNEGLDPDEWVELDVATVRQALEEGVDGLPQIIQNNLSNISDEDIQAVMNFRESLNEAAEANRYYGQQIWGAYIEENASAEFKEASFKDGEYKTGLEEGMKNAAEKYASSLTNSAGKTLDEAISEIDVSSVNSNSDLKDYGIDIENDEDLGKTYAEQVLGWDTNSVSYSGGTGEGTIVNSTTGQEMTLDDNFMRQALAQQAEIARVTAEFEAELGGNINSFNLALQEMVIGTSEETSQVLLNALNSEDKSIDYMALASEFSPEELEGLSGEEIMAKMGITNEQLATLGLESGQAFVEGLEQAVNDPNFEANYLANMEAKAQATISSGAEELGMTTQALEAYTEDLMENNEQLQENKALAAEVAVESARFSIALDKLDKAIEDNADTIRNAEKDSLDYYEALGEVEAALEDTFGVKVDSSFIEENLDLIEEAADGSEEAVNALRKELSKEIVCEVMAVDNFEDLDPKVQELTNKLADIAIEDIGIGVTLEDGEFLDAAQGLIDVSQMTVDEAQQYFNSLGYEPEFVTETQHVNTKTPLTRTHTDYDITWGSIDIMGTDVPIPTIDRIETQTIDDYADATTAIETPALSADGTPQIKSIKKTGASAPLSSSKSGGSKGRDSSSKSKPAKPAKKTKKSDLIERYKELTDALDDVSDAMDKASKKADKLYGSAKVKAMQEEIALSKQKVALLEKQIDEAEALLEIDKKSLDIAAQDLGLRFTYDGLGNITNYTQQLNELYEQLAEVEDTMNSMSTQEAQDEYKESTYEPLQEKISALEAAMDQYEETRELIEDLRTEIDDEVQSQIDKEFEIFKYKIEVKLDVNDREMKILDLLLKRIDDDAFAAAQSMALLTSKTDEMLENFSIYEQGINDIYAKHGLTPEAAANMTAEQLEAVGLSEAEIETLQEYNDGLIETTENLMDIKEQIEQSLIDLFDAWNDEINETIDKFSLLNDTLSAFQNIVDVLGYNRLGLSLDWQKDMIEAQNTVGLEQLESLVEKKEALEETAKTSQEHLEAAQKRLEKAQKTVKDENVLAELEADVKYWEEMVDKTQNELDQATVDVYTSLDEFVTQAVENYKRLTEAILEEWERSISAMGKTLEETMNMYDKAAELEERYVSNYEKAYSLSKLTSSIEKSLNDTTSLKHQQQLKDMLKEIQEIQESGKELSQYDLDYLQKKYDLTVAQMSLEDAYNAKTQVIRRRDSEGNWGYVYTANEEDKEAAMTTYRDKVYEMMELNENFIRDTESKLLEARQRMAEELAALADMALTEEEYNERATAIIEHYQELDSYYLGEIQKALDNNNTLYDSDALAFAEKAGFKLSTAIAFKNDYITITEEMAKTILSIEESTFKTREEYLQALAKATGLSVNTVTKLYEDGVIKALKLSEEQRDGIASIDEQNFKNKEDYLKEIAKITGLSIDEVTEMYEAGTLAAIAETEKLEGSVLGSNTVMTLSFGQTTLSVVTGYGTAAAAGAAFGAANTVLTAGLSANYATFAAVTEAALGIAGMSSETFGAVSKRVMETSKEKANQYKESVRQLGEQMKTSFSEGANAVTGFQKQYSAKIGECVTITKALSKAITDLMKKLNKLDPKIDSSFGIGDSTNINNVSDAINAWKNGIISSTSLGALIGAEIWMDPNSNWGNGQERINKMKELLGDNWEDVWKAQVDYSNKYSYSGQTYSEWFDKWKQELTPYSYNNMKSYDTGGYTGAWGPDGKLAMLHEKELVLNKQDTSNFLLALDVLERIISNVSANSLTFNPVQPINVGNLSGLQGLEQNITIHADFPDATSAKDIEEAFNLMINRASQYANIK